MLTLLQAYLDRRRDPNRPLLLVACTPVPLRCRVDLEVHPDHATGAVRAAVTAALLAAFGYPARHLGEPVHLSDAYAVVQGVEGVASCLVRELRERDAMDRARHATTLPAPAHLPALGARPDPAAALGVRGAEIASLAPADLTVAASGGLPGLEE